MVRYENPKLSTEGSTEFKFARLQFDGLLTQEAVLVRHGTCVSRNSGLGFIPIEHNDP